MDTNELTDAEAKVLGVLLEDEGRWPWRFADLCERVGLPNQVGVTLDGMESRGLVRCFFDRNVAFYYRATEAGERAHAAHFGRKAADGESWVWYSVACVAVLVVVVVAIWLGGA